MQTEHQKISGRAGNRRQLVLILTIAALSVGGSYLLFFSAREGSGWATTNHGEFVVPPRLLEDLEIRDESGRLTNATGVWWLWVVSPSACDQACEDALHTLRQLHYLLNKDAARVRRALVSPASVGHSQRLQSGYPKLTRLTGEVHALAPGIYIVDPIGNLVLYYSFADAGTPVLEDLKRLLKVSQIG